LFAGLGKQLELTDGWLYRSVGCSQCIDGYSGKVAVTQLKHWGDEDGTDALVRDGLVKLMAGLTTLAELERVLL
jgi:type II secretory ATPase GspE/PulE/Tfp pilus assembly ATPase PilB-like protein